MYICRAIFVCMLNRPEFPSFVSCSMCDVEWCFNEHVEHYTLYVYVYRAKMNEIWWRDVENKHPFHGSPVLNKKSVFLLLTHKKFPPNEFLVKQKRFAHFLGIFSYGLDIDKLQCNTVVYVSKPFMTHKWKAFYI